MNKNIINIKSNYAVEIANYQQDYATYCDYATTVLSAAISKDKKNKAGVTRKLCQSSIGNINGGNSFFRAYNELCQNLYTSACSLHEFLRKYQNTVYTVETTIRLRKLEDSVFTYWKRLLGFSTRLHCSSNDCRMIVSWVETRGVEHNLDVGHVGPKTFFNRVTWELAHRVYYLSNTPEVYYAAETEYKRRKRRLERYFAKNKPAETLKALMADKDDKEAALDEIDKKLQPKAYEYALAAYKDAKKAVLDKRTEITEKTQERDLLDNKGLTAVLEEFNIEMLMEEVEEK